MKKLCLCLCAIILTSSLIAQEKRKEVSINLSSSDSYGISYRFGTAKSLWRLNLLSSSIDIYDSQNEREFEFSNGQENNIDYYEYDNSNYGIGISIGKEFRNTVANKVEFRYGFDIGFNYNHRTSESINSYNNSTDLSVYKSKYNFYTPSINGVIGFNYLLNKHLALGIEVLPKISYRIGSETTIRNYDEESNIEDDRSENSSSLFSFDLNNNSARLSIAYRF